MPPVDQTPARLLQGDGLLDDAVDVAAAEPLVAQLGPAVQVDSRDDAHVGLAPLAAAVRGLRLEELERVEAESGLGDLERLAEDGAGLVLDEEEGAVGLALGDLLEEAEEVDVGEEEAGGVVCEGRLRQGARGRVAELVDFGAGGR